MSDEQMKNTIDSTVSNDMTEVKLISSPVSVVKDELNKTIFNQTSITDSEMMFKEGYEFLLEMSEKRNTIPLGEFEKFLPLYKKSELVTTNRFSQELKEYNMLSDEFEFRFDLTKPIKIVDNFNRDEVLCVLPPVRGEFKAIGSEYIEIFDRFKSRSDSDRPDYSAPATMDMINALIKSQKLSVESIGKAKAATMKMEVEALQKVNPDNPILQLFKKPEPEETSISESNQNDTTEEKDVMFDL